MSKENNIDLIKKYVYYKNKVQKMCNDISLRDEGGEFLDYIFMCLEEEPEDKLLTKLAGNIIDALL